MVFNVNVLIVTLTSGCLVISATGASLDYCKLNCRSKQHTLCKYTKNGPSAACTDVVRSGLSEEEKQRIVSLHNELRQKVAQGKEKRGKPGPQPAAKNMTNLKWDDELASIAQRWANQCEYDHDCNKVERFSVGQNLAEAESSEDDITIEELVQTWYDEVEFYNGQSVSSFVNGENEDGEEIGHYTQMVWGETTEIGCGFVLFKRDGEFVNYLVCNYGRCGNVEKKPVYQPK